MRYPLAILFCIIRIISAVAQQPADSLLHVRQRNSAVRLTDTVAATNPGVTTTEKKWPTDTTTALLGKETFFYRFFKKDYPNPRKAALLSILLPGSGQIYNRRWWKVPLAYGALGTLMAIEIHNIRVYRALKTAHYNKVNNLAVEPRFARYDAFTLRRARDLARRNVEFSSLGLGVGVLLISVEAFVDAHLKTFDVSDDLSVRVRPQWQPALPTDGNSAWGISLSFQLNR